MASKPKKKPRLASGRKARTPDRQQLNAANTSLRSSTVPLSERRKAVLAGDKTQSH